MTFLEALGIALMASGIGLFCLMIVLVAG